MKIITCCIVFVACVLGVGIANQAQAGIQLGFDQSSLINTGGNSWSIGLIVSLDNVGNADLTSPPRVSSVNVSMSFSPTAVGLNFVDAVAPTSGAIFTGSTTYSSGSPNLNTQLFASAISNTAATDPFLSNGGKLMTVNFTVNGVPEGTYGIQLDPTIDGGTFYTLNGGGGAAIAFNSVANGSISITAVPEPTSLVTSMALITAGGAYFYKRRKYKSTLKSI